MTISKTVNSLQDMGFNISLKNDEIVSVVFKGTPPQEAAPLLAELKSRKDEVVLFLQGGYEAVPLEELQSLYHKAIDDLARQTKPGIIFWLEKNRPDLARQIDDAEDTMFNLMDMSRRGEASKESFNISLKKYYSLFLTGINKRSAGGR